MASLDIRTYLRDAQRRVRLACNNVNAARDDWKVGHCIASQATDASRCSRGGLGGATSHIHLPPPAPVPSCVQAAIGDGKQAAVQLTNAYISQRCALGWAGGGLAYAAGLLPSRTQGCHAHTDRAAADGAAAPTHTPPARPARFLPQSACVGVLREVEGLEAAAGAKLGWQLRQALRELGAALDRLTDAAATIRYGLPPTAAAVHV